MKVFCEACRVSIEVDHWVDADVCAAMHKAHGRVWIVPSGDTLRDGTRVS